MNTPYKYERTETVEELISEYSPFLMELGQAFMSQSLEESCKDVTKEKLSLGTYKTAQEGSNSFAPSKSTPDFEAFSALNIGDWIGVKGEVMKTKRGELSVKVEQWEILAETKRSFPDKWHGISDPDTRYRQRYVDMWVTEGAKSFIFEAN